MKIELSKEQPSKEINISPEIKHLGINNIRIDGEGTQTSYEVNYSILNKGGTTVENKLHFNSENTKEFRNGALTADGKTNLADGIELPIKTIKITLDDNVESDEVITFELQTKNYLSLTNPENDFSEHLEIPGNTKILFSAPFGQGKSTFLNLYFKKNEDKYNTVKLFPVNYSIPENKDIFEYIKCEILYTLLDRGDIEFDKRKYTYLETLPKFVFKNIPKLLAPFLTLIPKIGRSAFTIYTELTKLTEEYFVQHDKKQVDDKKTALAYIQEAYNQAGSMYEGDFYTQLIRQLLERLKDDSSKENVLIIDDLDRLDPEHVFRILNIFSAHFDRPEYICESNKFDFDKVIVVCDYSNLSKIFAHKYGSNTDFAGYINKFFTNKIFDFNNKYNIINVADRIPENNKYYSFFLKKILKNMALSDAISLREILKIEALDFEKIWKSRAGNYDQKEHTDQRIYFSVYILLQVMDINTLVKKIKLCKEKFNTNESDKEGFDYISKAIIVELIYPRRRIDGDIFHFRGVDYKIELENIDIRNNYIIKSIRPSNAIETGKNYQIEFNHTDFYTLLLQFIEKNYVTLTSQYRV